MNCYVDALEAAKQEHMALEAELDAADERAIQIEVRMLRLRGAIYALSQQLGIEIPEYVAGIRKLRDKRIHRLVRELVPEHESRKCRRCKASAEPNRSMCSRHAEQHRRLATERSRRLGSRPWHPGGRGRPPMNLAVTGSGLRHE